MGKQWVKDKCSANKSELGFTCYSKESLETLKRLWNKRHPENKIDSNNSKEIWTGLRSKLNKSCNREKCW